MQVVTYGSGSSAVDLTEAQEQALRSAGRWLQPEHAYCQVSRGTHHGAPTFSDAQIARIAAGDVTAYELLTQLSPEDEADLARPILGGDA